VRAAGTLSPGDFGRLVVGRGGGRERWGTSSPREVGARAPLAQSRGGGRGDSARGGRGSTRRQAAYERGGARREDDWRCGGGHVGRRAPEEEEAGLLHPEVGDRSPILRIFEMSGSLIFSFSCSQGGAHRAPPHARQGVEVGRGRPHEVALVESAAGVQEHSDGGERGFA
jgi:hypothetical protein